MASVVGKTIFSDGKGKLHFGYYKTDDAVEFVDYKTWKKLSFKDVSKGDTNKQRVIKAIVKNQKQFNKKVDFNMWAKKQKRSFEDTMDWFIKNGWVSNITKRGIKEGVDDVLSLNEGISVSDERHFGKKGIIIMIDDNGKKVSAIFKDKKNADKFNRNKPSDIKKLLDLAKKTKYPKAIDESLNEAKEPTIITQLRDVVKNGYKTLKDPKSGKKMKVDSYSASAITQVYDAINKSNKDRFIKSGLLGMQSMSFKVLGKMKKESVIENRDSNLFYVLYQKKGVFGKPTAAGYKDRKDAEKFAKSLGNNHNTMILDKQSMKNVKGVKVKESVNEDSYDNNGLRKAFPWANKKELDTIYKWGTAFTRGGTKSIIKKYSKDKDFKPFIKNAAKNFLESVNESASKEAMGIAGFTGTRGSAVEDFITKNELNGKKLFQYVKKGGLKQRMEFVSAIAGKPGNKLQKMIISKFKLGESVNERMGDKPTGLAIIHKAAKKGSYPVEVVATMLGKVIKQELVKTPQQVPAVFRMMQGGYPRATISIEDKKGQILFKESVNEAELKLGVKYVNRKGGEGFIQTGGSKNPKDWFWFDGKNKHPYIKVKKELKPSKDQKKTGFGDYLKQGGRVWDNVNTEGESVNEAKFGYKDSTASYINKHKDEYKAAEKMNKGNEMKFYDALQKMEDKLGHPKTMLFISNALRGYGVDMYKDPKIKNPADAQEALFLLSK